MRNIERYLKKHNVEVEHILSAHCKNRYLIIRLDSGDEVTCYMLMYELMEVLPEDEFLTVRRGTIVRKTGIVSISDDGIYTMTDGSTFQRVKRFLNQHKVM